jgi:hypothetical protein
MSIATSQDLFFLILAIVTGGIGIFLCWALYEVARMLRQANEVVTETRERMTRIENAVTHLKEKLETSFSYFGAVAEGGKALLSFLKSKQETKEAPKRRKSKLFDEEDEQ